MIRIGYKLEAERKKRGLTLVDVEKAIKIKASFLSAIERGEYYKLPSPTYAQGFVKNYVQYLGFPVRETMALFRREFDEEREIRVLPEGFSRTHKIPTFRFRIRRRIVALAGIIVLFFGFLLFQNKSTFLPPSLEVTSPKENAVTTREVVVAGKTDGNMVVTVNGDIANVDDNGEFAKKITVFPGTSTVVVKAKNRANKETTVTRKIQVSE